MSYKTTLPWRKFPRDTLHNPSLLFIINRMKEEHRQAVFTVFLGLYCEADDDGFVDISDEEFFADQCLTDADTLKLILQHFEKRHLIEKVAKDVPIYRIVVLFVAEMLIHFSIQNTLIEPACQLPQKSVSAGQFIFRHSVKVQLVEHQVDYVFFFFLSFGYLELLKMFIFRSVPSLVCDVFR